MKDIRALPCYAIWSKMKGRCNNSNQPDYKYYGGRGIQVCERWNSYALFMEDMGPRPEGHSIDRIDSNGNYEPSNCRWASHLDQVNNARSNHRLTHNNQTMNLSQWAVVIGLPKSTLRCRAQKGWSPEQILGPKQKPGPRSKHV